MGDRITVEELIKWLSKYHPKSDVAFLIDGRDKTGQEFNAINIKEIIERSSHGPADHDAAEPDALLFINLT